MTKILVVDDEEGILELLDEDLSDDGFEVISGNNGVSALAQIYRERPDIVLLDLNIPKINGYEVLRELRRDATTENLPVILLTGVGDPPTGQPKILRESSLLRILSPSRASQLPQTVIGAPVRR